MPQQPTVGIPCLCTTVSYNRQHSRKESFENILQRIVATGNLQYNKRIRDKAAKVEENKFLALVSVQQNYNGDHHTGSCTDVAPLQAANAPTPPV